MQIWRFNFVIIACVLAGAVANADDAASRAIVEKAIEHAGGAKALTKANGTTAKMSGMVHVNGIDLKISGEFNTVGGDRHRISVSVEIDGQPITVDSVLNRTQGWIKINDSTVEMSADQLTEAKEAAYSAWVASLVPLRDKAFQLTPFGETEIAGRKAVGVNVNREGHRLINLFFDKETFELVRMDSTVRDETTSRDMAEQSSYSQFKTIDGIQYPTKIVIRRDGNLYADLDATGWKVAEKPDDAPFAKP